MWNFNTKICDGVFTFDHITPTDKTAECWTRYAEKLGYKKVAFLVIRTQGAEVVQKALEAYKPKSVLEWTSVERFNPGERDFRITLMKIQETKPELLYVFSYDPELPIILRQMHEIGWKIPVTTITMFDMDSDNPMLEGSWYVGSDSPTIEYRKWYGDVFKKKNVPYGTGVYDDYMEMVYHTCENIGGAGKPTGEQISAKLRQIKNFKGSCGEMSINDKGIFETVPTLLTIKNGVVIPVEKP